MRIRCKYPSSGPTPLSSYAQLYVHADAVQCLLMFLEAGGVHMCCLQVGTACLDQQELLDMNTVQLSYSWPHAPLIPMYAK